MSSSYLATLVENAHDAIYTRALEDIILTWNAGAERLYGYTAAEMIGRSCLAVVPPDCIAEMREKHDRLLRGEQVLPFETRRLRKDGQTVFVSVALSLITEPTGGVVGIAWIARDITDRKRAEEARNDALEYAENIVETVREPMLVLDGRLRVRTASRSFYRAFRVTREDTEGRLIYDLGNGQWAIPALQTLLEEILPQNTAFDDFEVTHEFPGIGRRVMLVNARRMYRAGNNTQLILLAIEDITERRRLEDERREMETRFTSLVKNIRDHSIFTLDTQGRITSWNREAEKILGYSEDEALGQHFSIIFTPDDLQAGIPAQELSIALREGRAVDERWHARKGGERFWALGIVTPTTDARGTHTGYSKILRDMTDRKLAEEALRREHEFSERLVETARTIVLVLDLEGRIVRFNSYLEELSGWRLEEVQGKCWFETLLPERDRQRIRELFGRAVAGERTLGNTNPIVTRDGRERDIEWFDAPLAVAQGELFGLLCTGQDITERKQVEERLKQSEAGFRAVVDTAVDAIITIDEHGIVQMVNPAAERLFGYTAGEMIGRNIILLMPSPYREEHDGYLARYLATGEKRIIDIGREVIGLRKDGTTFPMDLAVTETFLGDQRFFVGFLRDITERRQTEERFRLVVEAAPNAIVMVNADGNIALVNSQAEKFFHYGRDEMIGQPVEILVPDLFRANHPGYRASFFDSPSIRPMGAGRDLYGRRKDGSEFPVEIGLTPIQSREGFLVLSSIVDISERKQAEEDLRRSHDDLGKLVAELQEKNEEIRTTTQQLWQAAKLASVGELAASIAHELNNPLATMTLRLESLLEDASKDDPNRRALQIVQNETKRMSNLVANLLQFSRRGPEQISTVDIRRELTGTLELVDYHLKRRQIDIVQELAPDTPLIFADRRKLRQVFLNLFTNASDAMPQGGTLTLRSRATTLASGKAAVRMEVADTGIGIPPEHLARVFDPYFTTKEEGQGTGLGLAICRRIVEDHHGIIRIDSEAGKGSVVIIVLPVRDGTDADRLRGGPPTSEGPGNV
jgi:two-component system sensor kinase FixL